MKDENMFLRTFEYFLEYLNIPQTYEEMLNLISRQEMQNKISLRYYFTFA